MIGGGMHTMLAQLVDLPQVPNVLGWATFGALMWWKLRAVEQEVRSLRQWRHDMDNVIGRIDGRVGLLVEQDNRKGA